MARAPKDHKTNALRELDAAGIPHEELFFDAEPTMTGEEIARSQGEDPDAVFKTLVTQGKSGGYYVFLVPVAAEAELLHAQLAELIRNEVGERWQVLPAVPCVLAKLRNTYRYHIVVKAPLGDDLSAPLVRLFRARKVNPAVNAAVDIDPVDLL